jgi:hypothetical protein
MVVTTVPITTLLTMPILDMAAVFLASKVNGSRTLLF